ncbi:sugar phosphate isomerase/epimerase [Achromobacter sp. NFACC18-2]|uniref:sugar phosphate isomerase/epimerase family protein n=1 Tax=Achromobacter sp. NFACC18-2 TaxID=1564112 RepID=UPI0008D86E8F|nr:sugar phosphate isomerase/epimerase family protein [Achromobacter sp. NFACC18-2]SEJ41845.1 Sugar phosphate isomerase/epimerase [Achromobacter sp. NFACC18-2]
MRLAISNIAWETTEDEAIAGLLHRFGIDAIDVAPGKYFAQPQTAADDDIARVRAWWADRGIELTGMQALLFGTTGLNVFGTPGSQEAMLRHLAAVCRIGAGLGAGRIVFGSPKNRDRSGLNDQEAMEVAMSFFSRLGDIADYHGVVICLEPNPTCYGANFMTSCAETLQVVQQLGHKAIGMQFDTGALAVNGEDALAVLQKCSAHVCHVHASEPGLVPLGDGGVDHAKMAAALNKYLPDHLVSIEMLATKNEAHLTSIERALDVAIQHYRVKSIGVQG